MDVTPRHKFAAYKRLQPETFVPLVTKDLQLVVVKRISKLVYYENFLSFLIYMKLASVALEDCILKHLHK